MANLKIIRSIHIPLPEEVKADMIIRHGISAISLAFRREAGDSEDDLLGCMKGKLDEEFFETLIELRKWG